MTLPTRLLLWLHFVVPFGGIVVTRDEANIAGVLYKEPFIVAEFLISNTYRKALLLSSSKSDLADSSTSERITSQLLHSLTNEFCDGRTRRCTSSEYYLILDKIIEMNSEVYEQRYQDQTEVLLKFQTNNSDSQVDPPIVAEEFQHAPPSISESHKENVNNDSVEDKDDRDKNNDSCHLQILDQAPSPEKFYHYVKNSQPFIIRPVRQQKSEHVTSKTNFKSKSTINKPNYANDSVNQDEKEENLWSLDNLKKMFGNATVIVNASPTSDFDGPESLALWNISLDQIDFNNVADDFHDSDVTLIVRPAQIKMKFAQYIDLLRHDSIDSSNYYLEYFPVPVLINLAQEFLRKQQQQHQQTQSQEMKSKNDTDITTSRKHFSKFKNQIPNNSWSQFLSLRYHLLWLSGGSNHNKNNKNSNKSFLKSTMGINMTYFAKKASITTVVNNLLKKHLAGMNVKLKNNADTTSCSTDWETHAKRIASSATHTSRQSLSEKIGHDGSSTSASSTSRLHFDRFENVMNVIQGTKTFHLFPPSASASLYGGSPVISGSFTAVPVIDTSHSTEINLNFSSEELESLDEESSPSSCVQHSPSSTYTFLRDVQTVNLSPNVYHTYSPVDILRPDFKQYSMLEDGLKSMQVCDVYAGERIFVPAHWWHQVTSSSDAEGKTIATNMFFEPFYHRKQHNTTLDIFLLNDYYDHAKLALDLNLDMNTA